MHDHAFAGEELFVNQLPENADAFFFQLRVVGFPALDEIGQFHPGQMLEGEWIIPRMIGTQANDPPKTRSSQAIPIRPGGLGQNHSRERRRVAKDPIEFVGNSKPVEGGLLMGWLQIRSHPEFKKCAWRREGSKRS